MSDEIENNMTNTSDYGGAKVVTPGQSQSAERESQLAKAVEAYLAELEMGRHPMREAFIARYPEIADELQKCLDGLELVYRVGPQLSSAEHSPTLVVGEPVTANNTLGDYRIIGEIGRGGMGVVYEAQQISLDRRVALKVLPFAATLGSQQLNRFKNEARAAGTLDHPNIVAVYSVGTERGVHYYAMRFIEGQSLAEFIANLQHSKGIASNKTNLGDGSPTPSDPALADSVSSLIADTKRDVQAGLSTAPTFDGREYFQSAAQLGIQAAQALDHAHQNGIVHRDIKPGNLLLDADHKLWVTDFGLARIEADIGMTMTGDILGTLRYMSPEQALAKRAVIDHRTDIYSLGVTLYELFTLTPLFAGSDRQELLHKIALEEPRLPCKVHAGVPVDLETIVLKAIAKDPADRYATAQDMSDDLRRFLDGKPVLAHRIGFSQRFWRWTKRNPMVAMLMMAVATLATLVAVVTSIGYVWTTAALAEARYQGQVAAEQRDRADRQFHAARDAVDRMLTTAASELVDVPHSSAVREKLLEDALEFYEGFLQQKSSSPVIRYETALAYRRVGGIRLSLGNRKDAQPAFQEAIELLEDLVDEFPQEASYLRVLANCVSVLGYAHQFRNDEESIHSRKRSLALIQRLVAEHPAFPEDRKLLALRYVGLGNALRVAGHLSESIPHYRQALVEWEHLQKEHPQLTQDTHELAHICHWLGVALLDAKQLAEADVELCRAHTLREELLRSPPNSQKDRHDMAHIKQYVAALRRAQGRLKEAEGFSRQGIEIVEQLVEDFPTNSEYRKRISGLLHGLERRLWENGRYEEAEQTMQVAIGHWDAFLALAPGDSVAVRELARAHFSFGLRRYMVDEQDEKAMLSFRRTLELYETHLKGHVDDSIVAGRLSAFLASCPAVQFQDPVRAIALVKGLLQQSSRDVKNWRTLGSAHYAAGDWEMALDAFQKARTMNGESEAWDLFPMAMCQWRLKLPKEAAQSYDQAIEDLEKRSLLDPHLQILRDQSNKLLGMDADQPDQPK